MKVWHVEAANVERVERRLNELEERGSKVIQLLPASNPINVYIVWNEVQKNEPG